MSLFPKKGGIPLNVKANRTDENIASEYIIFSLQKSNFFQTSTLFT